MDIADGRKTILQLKMKKGLTMGEALNEAERDYPELFNAPEKKKSKYGNKKVTIDGINFDSQKEADYYCDLKLLHKAGEIRWFLCQVPIICNEGDDTTKPIRYYADFLVCENDASSRFIDVKASKTFQTDVYKLKKKLVKSHWGIEIEEVYR